MPPGSLATLPPSLQTHCALLALVLPPDIAFSHLTAAALWGWRLPGPPHRMPTIDIIRPSGQPRIRRPGLVSHRGMEQREIVCVDGLRLTSELDTLVDLAGLDGRGLGVDELVAIAAALFAANPQWSLASLESTVAHAGRRCSNACGSRRASLTRRCRPDSAGARPGFAGRPGLDVR